MSREMMRFWDAEASAGPYANNLHLAPETETKTLRHFDTSSLNVYRPDALADTQPTVSKH